MPSHVQLIYSHLDALQTFSSMKRMSYLLSGLNNIRPSDRVFDSYTLLIGIIELSI